MKAASHEMTHCTASARYSSPDSQFVPVSCCVWLCIRRSQVLTLLQPRAFSILLRQNRLGGQDKITPITAIGRRWEQQQRWRNIYFANGGAAPEGNVPSPHHWHVYSRKVDDSHAWMFCWRTLTVAS